MIPGWQMEAYERLRAEIVRSAVFDYKKALRKSDRIGTICEEQAKLERWFLSQWGQFLSGDNGEYIMEQCRKTYKTREYNNGKTQLPHDFQKKVYEAYLGGTKRIKILKAFGITKNQFRTIVRKWSGS